MEQKENKRKYTIYIHINKINNKKYIGQTGRKRISDRWGKDGVNYLRKYNNGKFKQPFFANAILKYGWENFKHIILEENLTKKEADFKEKYYIKKYKTIEREFGYNIREGGTGDYPEEKRLKGEKNPLWGRHQTEESNKKRSETLKGRQVSLETRKKISDAKKGKDYMTTEQRKEACKKRNINRENKVNLYMCIETEEVYSTEDTRNLGFLEVPRIAKAKKGTCGGFHWIKIENINFNNWEKQKKEILNKKPKNCKIKCVEKNKIFNDFKEAQKITGIDKSNIRRVCDGSRNTAGGYHWEYIEEGDNI